MITPLNHPRPHLEGLDRQKVWKSVSLLLPIFTYLFFSIALATSNQTVNAAQSGEWTTYSTDYQLTNSSQETIQCESDGEGNWLLAGELNLEPGIKAIEARVIAFKASSGQVVIEKGTPPDSALA